MKKIGLVGGTSWTSTLDYYRFINEESNRILGGLNFAECLIYSLNFEQFRTCNAAHNWDGTFLLLRDAALNLKQAGAELIVLGANTAHIVADRVRDVVGLPLIDIRAATVDAIRQKALKKVGLLGTVFTMGLDFYKNYLAENDLQVMIPDTEEEFYFIEETLLHELGKGIILPQTKIKYLEIIERLISRGAEGVILGCTEIPMLITQQDVSVPVFNTTLIHAHAAVRFAASETMRNK